MAPSSPPEPTHVLETVIYVRSMQQSVAFYTNVLKLRCVHSNTRNAVFPLGAGVLLLFQLGETGEDMHLPDDEGVIPQHGPTAPLLPYLVDGNTRSATPGFPTDSRTMQAWYGGERLRQHFCFAVDSAADVDAWDAHLQAKSVPILGRVRWPAGRGQSVYFADPDGNVGEVASKGIWSHMTAGGQ